MVASQSSSYWISQQHVTVLITPTFFKRFLHLTSAILHYQGLFSQQILPPVPSLSAPRYSPQIAFLHHPYFCGDLIQLHDFKSLPPTSPLNCSLDISTWISNTNLMLTMSKTEQMIPYPQNLLLVQHSLV